MKRSESIIKTSRLFLREIDETDAECIVRIRGNESVYRYFLNPRKLSISEHLKWYKEKYIISDDRIDWIALDDMNGFFVGIYGVKKTEEIHQVEVSYITSPDEQNKGYAAEAVNGLINWCKKKWETQEVIAKIHKDNIPSKKFAEKLGFQVCSVQGNFFCYRKLIGEK